MFNKNNQVIKKMVLYNYNNKIYSKYNSYNVITNSFNGSSTFICSPENGGKYEDESIFIPIFFNTTNNNYIRINIMYSAFSYSFDYINTNNNGIYGKRIRYSILDISTFESYFNDHSNETMIVFGMDSYDEFFYVTKIVGSSKNILFFISTDTMGLFCHDNTFFTGNRLPVFMEILVSKTVNEEINSFYVYVDEISYNTENFIKIINGYKNIIDIKKIEIITSSTNITDSVYKLSTIKSDEKILILLALHPINIFHFIHYYRYYNLKYDIFVLKSSVNELSILIEDKDLDGLHFFTNINENNNEIKMNSTYNSFTSHGLLSNIFISTIESVEVFYRSVLICEGINIDCMIKNIRNMSITSIEGNIKCSNTNYFEKYISIVKIVGNSFKYVVKSIFPYPPYIFSSDLKEYSLLSCAKPANTEIELNTLILLDLTGFNSYNQLELYATYYITFEKMNKEGISDNIYYYYSFINTKSDSTFCSSTLIDIINQTSYDVIFISSINECRTKITDIVNKKNIPMFVVNDNEGEECIENIFYGGYCPYQSLLNLFIYFQEKFHDYGIVIVIQDNDSSKKISELVFGAIEILEMKLLGKIYLDNIPDNIIANTLEGYFNSEDITNQFIIFLGSAKYLDALANLLSHPVTGINRVLFCNDCQRLNHKFYPFNSIFYPSNYEHGEVDEKLKYLLMPITSFTNNYFSELSFYSHETVMFWQHIVLKAGSSSLESIKPYIYSESVEFYSYKISFARNNRLIKPVSLIESIPFDEKRKMILRLSYIKSVTPYFYDYLIFNKLYQCDWKNINNGYYIVASHNIGLLCEYGEFYSEDVISSCKTALLYILYINSNNGLLNTLLKPFYLSYSDEDYFINTISENKIDVIIGSYMPYIEIGISSYITGKDIIFINTGYTYNNITLPNLYHTGPTIPQYLSVVTSLLYERDYSIIVVGSDVDYTHLLSNNLRNIIKTSDIELIGELIYDISNPYIDGIANELIKTCKIPCTIISSVFGEYNERFFKFLHVNKYTRYYGYYPISITLSETYIEKNDDIYNGTIVIQSFFNHILQNSIEFLQIIKLIENEISDFIIPTFHTYQLISGLEGYIKAVESSNSFKAEIIIKYMSKIYSTISFDGDGYSNIKMYASLVNDNYYNNIYESKMNTISDPFLADNINNFDIYFNETTVLNIILITDNTYNSKTKTLNDYQIIDSFIKEINYYNTINVYYNLTVLCYTSQTFGMELMRIMGNLTNYSAIFGCKSEKCYEAISKTISGYEIPFYYLGYSFKDYCDIHSYFILPTLHQSMVFTFSYINNIRNELNSDTPSIGILYDKKYLFKIHIIILNEYKYENLHSEFHDLIEQYKFNALQECDIDSSKLLSDEIQKCLHSWYRISLDPIHSIL